MKTTPLWIAGVSLLGASVGQLVQFLVSPVNPGDSAATQVAAAAAHPSAMNAAVVLDLPILLIIPAVIFIGLAAGYRTSVLARVGTVLTTATVLGAGYLLASDVVVRAAAQHPGGAAFAGAVTTSGVFTVVAVFYLAGHVVGFVLLGLAAWRNRTLPRWAAVSLIVWPLLEMGGSAAGLKPDVVLMDIRMPGVSGIDATRQILAARPETGVLVLTMLEDDTSVFAAMRAGARGYLLKGPGRTRSSGRSSPWPAAS